MLLLTINTIFHMPNTSETLPLLHGGDFTGIDVITFGSPCQDFSLAGRRAGLKGAKSSLIQQAIALIAQLRPSFICLGEC